MGFETIDNSRNHPLYLAHRVAWDSYHAAKVEHQVAEWIDDLTTAKSYRRVLELQLAANAAYIKLLESGVPAIEYVDTP